MFSAYVAVRRLRIKVALLFAAATAIVGLAAPASAELVGYVPTPGANNLTKCAGEKPWPVDIVARLDPSTHVVHEEISFFRPNTPCAAYYYVHSVSISDSSAGLENVRYVGAGNRVSQDVTYPVSRAGTIQFEIVTGNQNYIDCQFWNYFATSESQPREYSTTKGTGADC